MTTEHSETPRDDGAQQSAGPSGGSLPEWSNEPRWQEDDVADSYEDECECDSHTGVGDDLWQCDECGEVIRYVDDPDGSVTLTELHPYRNRRVRVEMVTAGSRPGNRGWWS